MKALLQTNAFMLNLPPKRVSTISASSHLRSSMLALDGTGMPPDVFSYPFAWSPKNIIAITCGTNIYSQRLDTKEIFRICKLHLFNGAPTSIEWGRPDAGKQDTLAVGTTSGVVELWDVASPTPTCSGSWDDNEWSSTCGMSWCGDVLAVGRSDATVSFLDSRQSGEAKRLKVGHKGKVHGVKWSPDGRYLASGDREGLVYVWDARACKALMDGDASKRGGKMKHNGPVKVGRSYSMPTLELTGYRLSLGVPGNPTCWPQEASSQKVQSVSGALTIRPVSHRLINLFTHPCS
jgi:cell division cycle protein 20 (cofactor of APC complex)